MMKNFIQYISNDNKAFCVVAPDIETARITIEEWYKLFDKESKPPIFSSYVEFENYEFEAEVKVKVEDSNDTKSAVSDWIANVESTCNCKVEITEELFVKNAFVAKFIFSNLDDFCGAFVNILVAEQLIAIDSDTGDFLTYEDNEANKYLTDGTEMFKPLAVFGSLKID